MKSGQNHEAVAGTRKSVGRAPRLNLVAVTTPELKPQVSVERSPQGAAPAARTVSRKRERRTKHPLDLERVLSGGEAPSASLDGAVPPMPAFKRAMVTKEDASAVYHLRRF